MDPMDQRIAAAAAKNPAVQKAAMQQLKNPAVQQAVVGQAKTAASSGAKQLGSYISDENFFSLKILSFFCGLAMLILSILSMVSIFGAITDPFLYVMNFYFAVFSFVIVMANSKDSWPGVESSRGWIERNFGVFKTNFGRGILKIFIGTLWLTNSTNWLSDMFGYILCVLGVLYILANYICCCCSLREKEAAVDLEAQVKKTTTR